MKPKLKMQVLLQSILYYIKFDNFQGNNCMQFTKILSFP